MTRVGKILLQAQRRSHIDTHIPERSLKLSNVETG